VASGTWNLREMMAQNHQTLTNGRVAGDVAAAVRDPLAPDCLVQDNREQDQATSRTVITPAADGGIANSDEVQQASQGNSRLTTPHLVSAEL
jgi:hypothetical protein